MFPLVKVSHSIILACINLSIVVVSCGDPPGGSTVGGLIVNRPSNTFNSMAIYTCSQNGFVISEPGNATIQCLSSGQWTSATAPQCQCKLSVIERIVCTKE